MLLIQLGEVIFGGVGSGLYGMLVFAMLAVFMAGLMIGRTPEYLGKKIEAYEMKMVSIVVLLTPLLVLRGRGDRRACREGGPGGHRSIRASARLLGNPLRASARPRTTTAARSGASRSTRRSTTSLLGIAMWFGRFALDRAGAGHRGFAGARRSALPLPGRHACPPHGPLFVVLLIGTVLLVGALTYVPALALGPVVEHLMMDASALNGVRTTIESPAQKLSEMHHV